MSKYALFSRSTFLTRNRLLHTVNRLNNSKSYVTVPFAISTHLNLPVSTCPCTSTIKFSCMHHTNYGLLTISAHLHKTSMSLKRIKVSLGLEQLHKACYWNSVWLFLNNLGISEISTSCILQFKLGHFLSCTSCASGQKYLCIFN